MPLPLDMFCDNSLFSQAILRGLLNNDNNIWFFPNHPRDTIDAISPVSSQSSPIVSPIPPIENHTNLGNTGESTTPLDHKTNTPAFAPAKSQSSNPIIVSTTPNCKPEPESISLLCPPNNISNSTSDLYPSHNNTQSIPQNQFNNYVGIGGVINNIVNNILNVTNINTNVVTDNFYGNKNP